MVTSLENQFRGLFSEGEWILSGGGNAYFRIEEIHDQVRIAPKKGKTDYTYSISFDKIKIILDNFDSIDVGSIARSVSAILREHGKSSTNEVYVFGLVREFIARLKLSTDGNSAEYEINFNERVAASIRDGQEKRRERLAAANHIPGQISTTVNVFIRNPDVVAEARDRANGICESCKETAPFFRKKDNTPYLEVHHKVPLAEGGDDTVENAIALCPNCHRKAHYG